jgi:hypothetical protein
MRLLSGLLCAVLAFNSAARVYAQARALCASARTHRTALLADAAPGALATISRARRRKPSVARVSFALGLASHPMSSSPHASVAAANGGLPHSANAAPPDHPPA